MTLARGPAIVPGRRAVRKPAARDPDAMDVVSEVPPRPEAGGLGAARQRPDAWPLAAGLVALLVTLPVLVVCAALAAPTVEVWRHLWATQLVELIGHTLALVVGVGLGVVGLGTALAWLVATYRFPGHAVLEWLLVLPLAVPAYVLGFVFLAIFDYTGPVQRTLRALAGGPVGWFPNPASYGGLVVIMTLVLYPYVYVLARASFLEQSPAMHDAARALGVSRWTLIRRIVLPLARPAIVGGVFLALMEALADFGTVALFNYPAFTVAIYRVWFGLFDRHAATELASLLVLVTLALYAAERGLRGRARFDPQWHGGRPALARLHGTRGWAATGAVSAVVALAFGLPVLRLLTWIPAGTAADPRYLGFLRNTLGVAAAAAILALTAALVTAYGVRQSRSPVVAVLARLATMGYALPGSVIAVGVLALLAWLDRRLGGLLVVGSLAGLVFAYVVRFLAPAYQAVDAGLARVTPSMDMAGRSLGLAPGAVLRRVHFPLLRRSLLTAALLVFVDTMKEMPATLLLRPLGYDTLAVRVWQFTSESLWDAAALPALTIVAAGVVPVVLLIRSSRS
jgi:iron(III) transport system permease protein